MLRSLLSRSTRQVPPLVSRPRGLRIPFVASTSSSTSSRYLSSSDSDGTTSEKKSFVDQESRVKDIYSNLFGDDSDNSSAFSSNKKSDGQRPASNPPSRAKTSAKTTASSIDMKDIPVRLWSDSLEISEDRWKSKLEFDDIPDWSPDLVSRISKERVKIHPDGIPTLSTLASLALPPPPLPHPGHGKSKEYAKSRKSYHYEYIQKQVASLAEPKISVILSLPTWQEKQDAVDSLFESVEFQLREKEEILNGHPLFSQWVESALETYLRGISKKEKELASSDSDGKEGFSNDDGNQRSRPSLEEDQVASPAFMDCYDSKDPSDQVVPQILAPLKPHPRDGPGRMVEEWELSAHDSTRRIMLRESTRKIARVLEESPSSRVFVSGRKGVGKSATLASIVASARKSGYIVLYLPDGNRLHRSGYYVRPNPKLQGLFDLPVLSQEVCKELLASHQSDLEGMQAEDKAIKHHFTDLQLEELEYSGGPMALTDLLKTAESKTSLAAMCYTLVIEHLMEQQDKPFIMVLDEFNCYYEPGHYFHMEYDNNVRNAIPYDRINLFKPAMDAMALSLSDDLDEPVAVPSKTVKKGGIIVGVSESCAVARRVTDALTDYAQRSETQGASSDTPLYVVEVPRFSEVEVDHILANFESIGIGNLRCDRGETVMNKDGVAYLRMVSSCVGQELLDVCCY